MQHSYTVNRSRFPATKFVEVENVDGCVVGRFFPLGNKWQARHLLRHEGGLFTTEQAAIDYIVGIDLMIEASFEGRVNVAVAA